MAKLVRLWQRPCKRGREFKYVLIWYDEQGKERWQSLGHADARKAERQLAQKERELRIGIDSSEGIMLRRFLKDSLEKTQRQVREGTMREYNTTIQQFIEVVGDMDLRNVRHEHGERFVQACQRKGNRSATIKKKISALTSFFKQAVRREYLKVNPFQHIRLPKLPKGEIHVFSEQECIRMINAARELRIGKTFRWDLFLLTALCTGMRRGELLNITWPDIDLVKKIIHIYPKDESEFTWKWQIKDTDRRDAPITEELAHLLSEYRDQQPTGYPYVFVPPKRYDRIQRSRRLGKWSERQSNCPHGNFQRQFKMILDKAGIKQGQFHDLRRTCLSNWFLNGLREYDVMKIAGHASFETTHKFYLAIRKDLLDQARALSSVAMKGLFIA